MCNTHFFASFLTSFLFLFSFLSASASMQGTVRLLASSQCCWSPSTHTCILGRGMYFNLKCTSTINYGQPHGVKIKILLIMVSSVNLHQYQQIIHAILNIIQWNYWVWLPIIISCWSPHKIKSYTLNYSIILILRHTWGHVFIVLT